ncbi:DUF7736 domain-containing protein [Pseudoalteromonas peptidolytica]|uniref:DUF7736 domain-containing protein n=1 Tax=Pseudoalteromonas peptidolytica F12-50-A1 TaxID=1315280 RepID=A0A8I0MZB0_9GAMM|nr:hypothetical protein [Pseudoalteromonas peptidolytica]MBE0348233.1 hypothetical protein [Pseudoalteromonas peptidolytica F12-50-A1]NLR16595.1 hypothetical protein [Pseudoalteromonas peptidolytica]GEK11882.1 hypothetical protein PPE03_41310 [Pseudoalteromonas peptidolytica]
MIKQLSKDEAIKLAETEWWKESTPISIATFQVTQDKLCCPIDVYKMSLNEVLKRDVFTHELAEPEKLIAEMNGTKPHPSFSEIMAMLPSDKTAFIKLD